MEVDCKSETCYLGLSYRYGYFGCVCILQALQGVRRRHTDTCRMPTRQDRISDLERWKVGYGYK
jgi:hypothetical protein